MASQTVDIYSMLNKAQNDYNQQNSVAAFFKKAGGSNNPQTMPLPIKSVNSLEQIERQIRASPPKSMPEAKFAFTCCVIIKSLFLDPHNNQHGYNKALQPGQTNNSANSPLAQFFNSNNFNTVTVPRQAEVQPAARPQRIAAPPGFNTSSQRNQVKETKLITPTMFAPSNNNVINNNNIADKKPPTAEPLTKNQLLQALNYLIANDDEFMMKIHQAYIKSFKTNI